MLRKICEIDSREAGVIDRNYFFNETVDLPKNRNDAEIAGRHYFPVLVTQLKVAQYALIISNEFFFAVRFYLDVLNGGRAVDRSYAAVDSRVREPFIHNGCSSIVADGGNHRDCVIFGEHCTRVQCEVCRDSSTKNLV